MAHMHYKGTGKMHSFRGLLADSGQDRIRIQGAVGDIAWRITKFQIMSNVTLSATATVDHVVKVWREEQSSVPTGSAVIDIEDDELLAVGVYAQGASLEYTQNIIFDNTLFVRNIWITHTDNDGADSVNYYIELEEVKVSAAGMAQLSVAAARRNYIPGT
jgi:hypothetical protein